MRRARRTTSALGVLAVLTASSLVGVTAAATAGPPAAGTAASDRVDNWTGLLRPSQLDLLRAAGLDHEDIAVAAGSGSGKTARVQVEATMNGATAQRLRAAGVPLELKRVHGKTAAETRGHPSGRPVFRTYSGSGGLQEELRALATAYPSIASLQEIGRSVNGTVINAVRVTQGAGSAPTGTRPAVVFASAQHAREWITPEMTRRLLRHVLERYGKNAQITRLVDTTDLYFVPVANPDGYDHTFLPGNRMWRKNLRDNNGDLEVVAGEDGVDPNRNWPTHWGFDDEGSSSDPGNDTYRGPAPASEPETRALDGLLQRVKPKFLVNYHSAAELILYGTGFQVATRTPDDLVYEALVGDDDDPAVPGYDPDLSAELYTTNGETTEHAHEVHGTLAFTPEMSTCEVASARYRDDAFAPEDCSSVFHFPDDERLVHEEVQKNIPFALAVARSAATPDTPVSVVGRTVPDFDVDSFSVSYGDPQTVAVVARRTVAPVTAHWRIGRGPVQNAAASEWAGGKRYGDEGDVYFAEYRGQVAGARPGETVEVWFSGTKNGVAVASEHFTYTLASDTGDQVLVLADEDYEGVNPLYGRPRFLRQIEANLAAVTDAGLTADLWDTTAQGVPHPLGVLSHFDGVLWYTGANRITQDAEDELTETPFGDFPDVAAAERQQHLTLAVRDYLNEDGTLVVAGEMAQYYGEFAFIGGLYYGLNGDETADCVIESPSGLFDECLILADDFSQYWLGAYRRISLGQVDAASLTSPFATSGPVALGAAGRNALDEAGAFELTSEALPPARFPEQFLSRSAGEYVSAAGTSPFAPPVGDFYAGTLHTDDSYMRLARTIDLSGSSAPGTLDMQLSWNTEQGYDHVLVEAHTVGQDDWTTLPDRNGHTTSAVPTECEAGFLLEAHPFLTSYLTPGTPCTAGGTTGAWHSFTGNGGGWQQVSFDLSQYAGKQVEVAVTYVTDSSASGIGVFVDDIRVGGATEGFEVDLGAWEVPTAPPVVQSGWVRSTGLVDVAAAVATDHSVLLGFGLEHVQDRVARAAVLRQAFAGLDGGPRATP